MSEDSEFITRCPSCGTSFRLTLQQMQIASGAVRCGACLRIFQSDEQLVSESVSLNSNEVELIEADLDADTPESDHWVEALPEPVEPEEESTGVLAGERGAEPNETVADDSSSEAVIQGKIDTEEIQNNYWQAWEDYLLTMPESPGGSPGTLQNIQVSQKSASQSSSATTGEQEDDEDESQKNETQKSLEPEVVDFISSMVLDEHPEVLIGELKSDKRLHPLWIVTGILLVFSSLLQYAWFNKDIYAQRLEYRSYYLMLCGNIGCVLPEYKNPQLLVAKNLLIRSHPEVEGALVVDAILRNSGRFRQEFPDLRLLFQDIENLPVAARRFSPADYLAGELRGLRYIPASTEVRFSIEILDPGENALGYSLEVLPRG